MDRYVIRIDGELPDDALDGFESLSIAPRVVQTVLYGDLPDQAALTGILDHLDEMGVTIVGVVKVPGREAHPDSNADNARQQRG
jgi:hypothetical protein